MKTLKSSFINELESIKEELKILYIDYLNENCDSKLKKDKIIFLKEKFGDEISTAEIVEAVNCSRSYARQFYIIDAL